MSLPFCLPPSTCFGGSENGGSSPTAPNISQVCSDQSSLLQNMKRKKTNMKVGKKMGQWYIQVGFGNGMYKAMSPRRTPERLEVYDCSPLDMTPVPKQQTPLFSDTSVPSVAASLDASLFEDGNRKRRICMEDFRADSPLLDLFASPGKRPKTGVEDDTIYVSKKSGMVDRLISVLDRPFVYWRQLNHLFKQFFPVWTAYQRGRIIHHLIHFLELKIGMDEYVPSGLLLPTTVVEDAWRALVMETNLYLRVIYALQDFHDKPREMIHYTFIENRNLTPRQADDKIRRTQSLFVVYFNEMMPTSIEEEPREPPAKASGKSGSFQRRSPVFQAETRADHFFNVVDNDVNISPRTATTATTWSSSPSEDSDDESEALLGLGMMEI